MFERRIKEREFLGDPFSVASDVILGSYLCSNIGGKLTVGKITELEVYAGAEDKACHAYQNRKTERNKAMFESGGIAYVFLVYGMYHQFNVVVSEKGEPNALLIRSLEPIIGIDVMQERRKCDKIGNLTTGPGKLCQALGITRDHNALDLQGGELWLSPRRDIPQIEMAPRVGIDHAEEYAFKPWRYLIKDNPFVSGKK